MHLIHLAEPDPDFVGYLKADQAGKVEPGHDLTHSIGNSLKVNGIRTAQTLTLQGPVLTTILDHARKVQADLLYLVSTSTTRFIASGTATLQSMNKASALPLEPRFLQDR